MQRKAIAWLASAFVFCEKSSIAKSKVYRLYMRHCKANNIVEPLAPNVLGRLVHKVFSGIKTTRKNTCKKGRYHYLNLKKRKDLRDGPMPLPEDWPTTSSLDFKDEDAYLPHMSIWEIQVPSTSTPSPSSPVKSKCSPLESSSSPPFTAATTFASTSSFATSTSYTSSSASSFSSFLFPSPPASPSYLSLLNAATTATTQLAPQQQPQPPTLFVPNDYFDTQTDPSLLLRESGEECQTFEVHTLDAPEQKRFENTQEVWRRLYNQIASMIGANVNGSTIIAELTSFWKIDFVTTGLEALLHSDAGRNLLLETERSELAQLLQRAPLNSNLKFLPIYIQSAARGVVDPDFYRLHGQMVEDCLRYLNTV